MAAANVLHMVTVYRNAAQVEEGPPHGKGCLWMNRTYMKT